MNAHEQALSDEAARDGVASSLGLPDLVVAGHGDRPAGAPGDLQEMGAPVVVEGGAVGLGYSAVAVCLRGRRAAAGVAAGRRDARARAETLNYQACPIEGS